MARKRYCLFALIVIALVLASCSVVFEAGISGKVVTASGTSTANVQDVSVFAYTDSSLRDSDFAKFQAGTITRPTEGSGYVATTTTNANGEFTVNKVVWETKKSEFGKTADISKLYLIFYHEDYKPAKADATVISGSTNSSNVYVKLEASKEYTTLNITVYDVATGTAMTNACNLEYLVEGKESSDSVVVTGTSTVRISYPKDTNPDVTMKLTSPGSSWRMTDNSGALIEQLVEEDVEEGTLSVSLYMKSFALTLPSFSGDINGAITDVVTVPDDNLPIRLAYFDKNGVEKYFAEVDEAQLKTYSDPRNVNTNVLYRHGVFSGVGSTNNYSLVINRDNYPEMGFVIGDDIKGWDDLTGKTMTIRLKMYFDNKYYLFDYSQLTNAALGHIQVVSP